MGFNKKMNKKIALIISMVLILSILTVLTTTASATTFHHIYGNIKIDGNYAAPGSEITIKIPEENFETTIETYTLDENNFNYDAGFSDSDYGGTEVQISIQQSSTVYTVTLNKNTEDVEYYFKNCSFTTDDEDDEDDNNQNPPNGDPGEDGREDDDEQPPADDDPLTYAEPTADAGGPYDSHFIKEQITFDGSKSTGDITYYNWSFGDGNKNSGKTVTHSYSKTGIYTVTLTCTGPAGTDSDTVNIEIIVGSGEPEQLTIEGNNTGKINQTLHYNVSAVDPDGQNITYNIDWDDGNTEQTEYYNSGVKIALTHSWNTAGVYTVKVYAEDETNKTSATKSLEVLINTLKIDYNDSDLGYLKDTDNDNVYDTFQNNNGNDSTVTKDDKNNYLIDTDGDGKTDYLYNESTGATQYKQDSSTDEETDPEDDSNKKDEDNTALYIGGIILLLIIIGIVFFASKKKQK